MANPDLLFELLENSGYIAGNEVCTDRLRNASLSDIVALAEQSKIVTSAEQIPRSRNAFTHTASLSLGGSRHTCGEISCRLKRINELSQFAAFYSDKVYVHNPLAEYAAHPEKMQDSDLDWYQQQVRDDLIVLLDLRVLIEAGRITPVTMPLAWCVHCFGVKAAGAKMFDESVFNGFEKAGIYLRQRFLTETQAKLRSFGKKLSCEMTGPVDLYGEHGFHAAYGVDGDAVSKLFPELRALALRQGSAKIKRAQFEKLGFHEEQAADILSNVLFEYTTSQSFATSLLTERPIHIKLLQSLSIDDRQERRNAIIRKHLTTLVPFLPDLPSQVLLKLREDEADSFIVFRKALNQAVDDATDRGDELTELTARQIYGDVIEPGVSKLELKLVKAKDSSTKSSTRKAISWMGAISVGLLTGIAPAGLQAAATVLGLTKIIQELTESALIARGDENLIRDEDMYFLWKVRAKTK